MPGNHSDIEKTLWDSADKLRANSGLKSHEYSTPVLGLIFLRYADFKFSIIEKELTAKIQATGGRKSVSKADYQARGVMYLPDKARYSYLLKLPEGADVGKAVNDGMKLIEAENEKLKEKFKIGHKRQIAEALKWDVEATIKRMAMKNKSRLSYLERFQKMIEEYNSGSMNVEEFFDQLIKLVNELDEEEKRGVREQLTEEELAIFDLLTKPEIDMTEKEKNDVKKVAHALLESLKDKLVIDWRKRQESRAMVHVTIEDTLDKYLPRVYTPDIYRQKVDLIYQHVYDSYYGEGKSLYAI